MRFKTRGFEVAMFCAGVYHIAVQVWDSTGKLVLDNAHYLPVLTYGHAYKQADRGLDEAMKEMAEVAESIVERLHD